jgi:hypothetical protein
MQETEGTLTLDEDGLHLPEEVRDSLVVMVMYPEQPLQKVKLNYEPHGAPPFAESPALTTMPSDRDGEHVPGGCLRINGSVYEIEDQR